MAVNSSGQVVGFSGPWPGRRPVLWESGVPYDLNEFLLHESLWELWSANGINDHGQIAGRGSHNGVQKGYVLPLPDYPTPGPVQGGS